MPPPWPSMTQILFIVDIKPFENKGHKELPQAGLHGLFS
jgi:hypothetical protein